MAKPKAKDVPKRPIAEPGSAEPEGVRTGAKAGVAKARVVEAGPAKSAAKAGPTKSRPSKARSAKLRSAKVAGAAPDVVGPGLSDPPADRLERLWGAVQQVREGRRDSPRTARLLAAGPPKLAQKVVEEAAEVAIEAVTGKRDALINESVDLLYNLVALWNGLGVQLPAIWAEMDRREATLGMAEKLPKIEEV